MNIGMTKAIATQAAKDEIAKVGTGVDNVARTGVNEVKSQLDDMASKDYVDRLSTGTPLFASNVSEMIEQSRNYVNTTDGYVYCYNNGWYNTMQRYTANGLSKNQVTQNELAIKFDGLESDIVIPSNIIYENNTDVALETQTIVSVPVHTNPIDIFIKIKIPENANKAGSFMYLNSTYKYPIGIADVNVNTKKCDLSYHGDYCGQSKKNNVDFGQQYWLRVNSTNNITKIKLYNLNGVIITDYTFTESETFIINNIKVMGLEYGLIYDIFMFDGLLTDEVVQKWLFPTGSGSDTIKTISYKGKTYKLGEEATPLNPKPLEGKKYVHFGDSIIGNYSAPTDIPTFVANITGLEPYNVGFGGCCMAKYKPSSGIDDPYNPFCMVELVDAIVSKDWTRQDNAVNLSNKYPAQLARLKSIDFNIVDLVIISYGTNDFTCNRRLDGVSDLYSYDGALRYCLDKLLTNFPKLNIIVTAPMWRARMSPNDGLESDINPNGVGLYLKQYGEKIEEICNDFHVEHLNLYKCSGINRYTNTSYLADGLHPNDLGREYLGSRKYTSAILSKF